MNEGGEGSARTLRAVSVSRSFEGVVALRDVGLELHAHEVLGLIGPNGAGKSTLVNIVSGFDQPTSGHIELEGRNITGWPPHRRGRAGLARTFQNAHAFSGLSVRENIEVSALGCGADRNSAARRADELMELLGLREMEDVPAGTLPHGEERKLGVARALATEPRFVLMDEPAAGLSETEVPAFVAVVRSVREEHDAGVLLIDHNMALIMEVCDRVQVLDEGRTIAVGSPEDVRRDPRVAAAYLGRLASREEGNG
jgi:branched-chain amino acid transport system ATP-binding protein